MDKREDENEKNRLIIDQGESTTGLNKINHDTIGLNKVNHDTIGTILNMVDVGEGRRLSSSPSSSMSPPMHSDRLSQNHENGRRSCTESPIDEQATTVAGIVDDLVNSQILNIACGYLTAKLYMDRFYCPGIHQLCIEYNGQFLTPKQFTIVAAKDKQKDWKGAIKINRQPVRILFERNLLDFYKHNEYCSGRCVSKSYKPLNDPSSSSSTTSTVEFVQHNGGTFVSESIVHPRSTELAAFARGFVVKTEPDDDEDEGDHIQRQHQPISRRTSVENLDLANIIRNANGIDLTTAVNGSASLMHSEPLLYWNCVSQLGLFHELTQEIEQQLQVLKSSFGIPGLRPRAARKLSDLVRVLDVGDKIQQKLIAKRTYANAQCALLANELNELRKIAETQEKKQREEKRKSELLDHLIGNLQDQKRRRQNNAIPPSMVVEPSADSLLSS